MTSAVSGAESRSLLSRWTPTVSMQLVCVISFIDRNALSILAPTIMLENHLSGQEYGYVISAFSFAYMAGNPIWGRMLDRFGLRLGMSLAVLAWTLASISHAFCTGFWGFVIARAALGFGEGATFPGGLRTVAQTLPVQQRSRGTAVAYSGGALGGVLAPLLVTPVFVAWGWRAAFWLTGGIGLAWIIFWLFVSRRPDLARSIPQEQTLVPPPQLRDPRLAAFVCAYALGALPMGFVIYDGAIYLHQALGQSQADIGRVLWLPAVGWESGYFFWGWLADRMISSGVAVVSMAQRIMRIAASLSLLLAVVPFTKGVPLTIAELTFAMFVATGFVMASLAYATSIYSVHNAGLIGGIGAGSWGAAVALTMPLLGKLFDRHSLALAFLLVAICPAIGYAGWAALTAIARQEKFQCKAGT